MQSKTKQPHEPGDSVIRGKLKKIRAMRNLVFIMSGVSPFVALAAHLVFENERLAMSVFALLGFFVMVLAIVTVLRSCPRCKNSFYGGFAHNLLNGKCVSCGLELNENGSWEYSDH